MSELISIEKTLTNENIMAVVDSVASAYAVNVRRNAIKDTKLRIALEEMLLRFRDYYGAEAPCIVAFGRQLGRYFISVSQRGKRNEYNLESDEERYTYDILSRIGVAPKYMYSRRYGGSNMLIWEDCTEPVRHSMLRSILISLTAAVIIGLCVNLLPSVTRSTVAEGIVTPVLNKMTSILSALATPLVFFAVIGGILGIGDVRSFGKIGITTLTRMAVSYLIAGACAILSGSVFLGLPSIAGQSGGGSPGGGLLQLVLDIIPNNLLKPFTEGNDLQVIVIAIFIGAAMLMLGSKLKILKDLVTEASDLINKMMSLCTKLLPVVVFFGTANLIIGSNAEQFVSIGRMLIVYLGASIIFIAIMLLRVKLTVRVPFKTIFPKQLSTLLINLTTSSQVAALPENMLCCKKKFGIDEKMVDFGLPLGIVVYMPSGAIFLMATAWGLSALAGIPVTVAMIVKVTLVSIITAVAAPPIPGSAFVVIPIMFAACGVSNDALPLAIIFGTIVGYILPAVNGFILQLELLMTAKKLGKLDEKALNAEYAEESATTPE